MRLRSLTAVVLLALPVVACAPAAPPASREPATPAPAPLTRHALPADLTYPEGIAYDASSNAFYTASAVTGAVVRVDLASGQASTIAPAGSAILPADPFPSRLGMKLDDQGRLWIAGGRTGGMAVIKAADGTLLKRLITPTAKTSLINDVTLAGGAAYFTDTFVPTLWRVRADGSGIGELERFLDFTGTALAYADGPNLNGIAATANGEDLIVVQMNKGLLFRIHLADRSVSPIDTRGAALETADGLVLDGRTLYVVRQGEQEIVTLDLAEDLASATVVHRFKDPMLMWTATAAKAGDQLLVVNTQFNKRETNDPVTPFAITGVPLSRLRD